MCCSVPGQILLTVYDGSENKTAFLPHVVRVEGHLYHDIHGETRVPVLTKGALRRSDLYQSQRK